MTAQELQFELMKKATFNGFAGEHVVASLQENKDLWRGVVMDSADYCFHGADESDEKIRLIKLRDIHAGHWNVDTLYLLPSRGKERELESLARDWGADEVSWIGGRNACSMLGSYSREQEQNDKAILRVWWD